MAYAIISEVGCHGVRQPEAGEGLSQSRGRAEAPSGSSSRDTTEEHCSKHFSSETFRQLLKIERGRPHMLSVDQCERTGVGM